MYDVVDHFCRARLKLLRSVSCGRSFVLVTLTRSVFYLTTVTRPVFCWLLGRRSGVKLLRAWFYLFHIFYRLAQGYTCEHPRCCGKRDCEESTQPVVGPCGAAILIDIWCFALRFILSLQLIDQAITRLVSMT